APRETPTGHRARAQGGPRAAPPLPRLRELARRRDPRRSQRARQRRADLPSREGLRSLAAHGRRAREPRRARPPEGQRPRLRGDGRRGAPRGPFLALARRRARARPRREAEGGPQAPRSQGGPRAALRRTDPRRPDATGPAPAVIGCSRESGRVKLSWVPSPLRNENMPNAPAAFLATFLLLAAACASDSKELTSEQKKKFVERYTETAQEYLR